MTNSYSVRDKDNEYFKKDIRAAWRMTDGRLSGNDYDELSPHDHKTAARRFGSWNDAKGAAGLKQTEKGDGSAYGRLTEIEKRERIYSFKESLVCESCGADRRYPAIEFHHPNPNEKVASVSDMLGGGYTIEQIHNEIEKCIPVCSNCHREIEAGLRAEPWESEEAEADDAA